MNLIILYISMSCHSMCCTEVFQQFKLICRNKHIHAFTPAHTQKLATVIRAIKAAAL